MDGSGAKDGVIYLLTLLLTGSGAKAAFDAWREWRKDRSSRSSPERQGQLVDASVLTMQRVNDDLGEENTRLRNERDYWQGQYQASEERRVREMQAEQDRRRELETQLRDEMRGLREYADGLEVKVRQMLSEVLELRQKVAAISTGEEPE